MSDRLRAAAEAALEALVEADPLGRAGTIEQLRAALAEPQQKPAAWIREDTAITTDAYQAACWRDSHTVTPLYTTPPSREWKGLTDEEREVVMRRRLREHVMRTVEAMLKRKNT